MITLEEFELLEKAIKICVKQSQYWKKQQPFIVQRGLTKLPFIVGTYEYYLAHPEEIINTESHEPIQD